MDPRQVVLRARGLLFDLDGTLVDSTHAVEHAWLSWAHRRGIPTEALFKGLHGRRAADILAGFVAEDELDAEFRWMEAFEATYTEGVAPIPGAAELIDRLPSDRWGIVTNGTRPIAQARLNAAKLPTPGVFVTADEVYRGKPDPAPYLLGAARLGIAPEEIVAFEDSEHGVLAAEKAGMKVIVVGEDIRNYKDLNLTIQEWLEVSYNA